MTKPQEPVRAYPAMAVPHPSGRAAARVDHTRGSPGTWRPVMRDGRLVTASLACPQCGRFAQLDEHDIGADGRVSPSVVCPNECGFHDAVKLEGWRV